MRSGIYRITNTTNNKVYIGSSKRIAQRLKEHFYELNKGSHKNTHLQSAFTIDPSHWKTDVIEECDVANLIEREQHWLDYYKVGDHDVCYNIEPMAERCCLAEETRKKISETKKRRWREDHQFREQTIAKSQVLNRRPEVRAKIAAALTGRKASEETKSRKSIAAKTSDKCKSQRALLAESNRGRTHTPEAVANMREAQKKHMKKVGQFKEQVLVQTFGSLSEAAQEAHVSIGALSMRCNGLTKSPDGFEWRYI